MSSRYRQSRENSCRSQSPGKAAAVKFTLDQAVLRDFCRKIEAAAENSRKRVQMGHENEGKWEA